VDFCNHRLDEIEERLWNGKWIHPEDVAKIVSILHLYQYTVEERDELARRVCAMTACETSCRGNECPTFQMKVDKAPPKEKAPCSCRLSPKDRLTEDDDLLEVVGDGLLGGVGGAGIKLEAGRIDLGHAAAGESSADAGQKNDNEYNGKQILHGVLTSIPRSAITCPTDSNAEK